MLTKLFQIVAKVESSEGTAETLPQPSTWAASTAYSVGDYVIPTTPNGYFYVCTVAGTSDTSEPTWPATIDDTVVDNTVTWKCVATGWMNAYNPDFTPGIEAVPVDTVCNYLSPAASLMGKRQAILKFDVNLVGAAAAGEAVPYATLLKGCKMQETLTASTSAEYTPLSTGDSSLTLGFYLDGKLYKMWGCRGNVSLDLEVGKPGVLHFEFTGADFSESDASLLSGITCPTVDPPIFMGADFTIDSYAAKLSALHIDLGNNVILRDDPSAASGNFSAFIVSRRPIVTFDPENVLVATYDFLGKWRSGSQLAMTMTFGSTAGNICTISAPKVQAQTISLADRNGLSVLNYEGLLAIDNGDDELSIKFT